jgi:hypothetical protein
MRKLIFILLLLPFVVHAQTNTTVIPGKLRVKVILNNSAVGDSTLTADVNGNVKKGLPANAGVLVVSGTSNRITSTGGTSPVIDISGSYAGQSSITTLGTIISGVWHGAAIDRAYLGLYFDNNFTTAGDSVRLSDTVRIKSAELLGVSTIPNWASFYKILNMAGNVGLRSISGGHDLLLFNNLYNTSGTTTWNYAASGFGCNLYLDNGGGINFYSTPNSGVAGATVILASPIWSIDRNGNNYIQHIVGNTSTPTILAGAGAGTTPTASITGTDIAGLINITTGTSPNGGNAIVATITFNNNYPNAPYVEISPANRNAQALAIGSQVLVPANGQTNGVTTAAFVIESGATGLAGSTAYIWTYHVIQ